MADVGHYDEALRDLHAVSQGWPWPTYSGKARWPCLPRVPEPHDVQGTRFRITATRVLHARGSDSTVQKTNMQGDAHACCTSPLSLPQSHGVTHGQNLMLD